MIGKLRMVFKFFSTFIFYFQETGIIYRNICSIYDLDPPKTRSEVPQKIMENNKRVILWDFSIQADKQVLAKINKNVVIIDKNQKSVQVIDIEIILKRRNL